jgi:hypothetical protein
MKNAKSKKNGIVKYAFPLTVIVAVAAIGIFFLFRGHAGTAQFLGFLNYQSQAVTPGVFQSQDDLPGIGAQYISDVSPKSQLVYANFQGKYLIQKVCYSAKAYNSPKSTTQVSSAYTSFGGIGSRTAVYLPTDGNYYEICVPSGTGTTPAYNVFNQSPYAYVFVYQTTVYYQK